MKNVLEYYSFFSFSAFINLYLLNPGGFIARHKSLLYNIYLIFIQNS